MATKRITEYIGTLKGSATAQKQLRQLVERYPYYQAARLLLLRSLYDAHDPSFGQELRKAALYVPSRKVLYSLIEADRLKPMPEPKVHKANEDVEDRSDRTYSLIDNFLTTQVDEEETPKKRKSRPTVDASTDYVSYMLQIEADAAPESEPTENEAYGSRVIDDFLTQGKITLQEHPDEELQRPQIDNDEGENEEVLTETLARIYIKQGKYDKALEIIQRLSLKYPRKNRYFADQIRYLEKLIVNDNNKK
ncbi:MAG: tetratricopeptide repeat protein [Bacteroidaceae bacterium]|nr:tetratricopeptide repeat protein [Bacteroidaceae bacterium]